MSKQGLTAILSKLLAIYWYWVTSPMGLLGCPASFQRLMETVVNGISSFDFMLTLLQLDPIEQGTVVVDANRLLLFKYW